MQLRFRPHHLLCIQKFKGRGYDVEFTAHMTAVTAALADNPATEIILTKGCDELCKRCPHNLCHVCTSLEKVAFMDSAVLTVCKFTYGEQLPWSILARTARKKIFETNAFQRICGSCEWFPLCKNTEAAL